MPTSSRSDYEKIAIMDIGSNSIRLMVYEGLGAVPLPVFNEKAQCALAHNLAQTGLLPKDGVAKAYKAIERYAAIIKAMGAEKCIALATAAIREARDGQQFVAEVEKRFGIKVRVIDGTEEAELAGLGVLASMHDVDGVSADLGGGSLEMAVVDGIANEVGARQSWPIGVLRLMDVSGNDIDAARTVVADELRNCQPEIIAGMNGKSLYAIGGSVRALAKLYIEENHYPIKMLHQYSVDAAMFRDFCGGVMRSATPQLLERPGITRKRSETLPFAAVVLRRLIKIGKPAKLVFSMEGIREGALYKMLVKDRSKHDPLTAVAEEIAAAHGGNIKLGRLLNEWIAPVFDKNEKRWVKLRHAACVLSTIPLYELSAERSELAFYSVLQAPLLAISHSERFLLSLALMYRYQHRAQIPLPNWEQFGISAREQRMARLIGLALNLAYTASGGIESLLTRIRLVNDSGKITVESKLPGLSGGDVLSKRIDRVQQAL